MTVTNPAPLSVSPVIDHRCVSCKGGYRVEYFEGVNGDPFANVHICAGCVWLQRLQFDLAARLGAPKACSILKA
jgi:hypothetical protein